MHRITALCDKISNIVWSLKFKVSPFSFHFQSWAKVEACNVCSDDSQCRRFTKYVPLSNKTKWQIWLRIFGVTSLKMMIYDSQTRNTKNMWSICLLYKCISNYFESSIFYTEILETKVDRAFLRVRQYSDVYLISTLTLSNV